MKIQIKHKAFGDKILYQNLQMEVLEGEIFALIGPNGVGKTSLMKMILGWDKDYQGKIEAGPGQNLAYSPESPVFPEILTGLETMAFFIEVRGSQDDPRALMETVGLDPDNKTLVGNYSKGMKQRLGVAQALIGDPDILLLDEPSAGLDYFGQRQMQDLILSLKKQGKIIVLNSHLLFDVEQICDRGIILMGSKHFKAFDKKDLSDQHLGDLFMTLAKEAGYESAY